MRFDPHDPEIEEMMKFRAVRQAKKMARLPINFGKSDEIWSIRPDNKKPDIKKIKAAFKSLSKEFIKFTEKTKKITDSFKLFNQNIEELLSKEPKKH